MEAFAGLTSLSWRFGARGQICCSTSSLNFSAYCVLSEMGSWLPANLNYCGIKVVFGHGICVIEINLNLNA